MVLNCIVDDSALIEGLREDNPGAIKQWIADGLVNIFVPLHTLEILSHIRNSASPLANEARKSLEWLDRITTVTENKSKGRVQLQGPDDQYSSWQEVENHLLPETPLTKQSDVVDDLAELDLSSQHDEDPLDFDETDVGEVPAPIRPLLNFVVWRSNRTDLVLIGQDKYILLTNDIDMQKHAQRFGIRAKLVQQLKKAFARNKRRSQAKKSAKRDSMASNASREAHSPDHPAIDSEHSPESERADVLDPDHFGRTKARSMAVSTAPQPPSDAPLVFTSTNKSRGKSSKGRSATSSREEKIASQNGWTSARGGNTRGALTRGGAKGEQQVQSKAIDPDSYVRPRTRGSRGRLWEPT